VSGRQSQDEFSVGGQEARRDWFYSVDGGSGAVSGYYSDREKIAGEFKSNASLGCVEEICPVPWAVTDRLSVVPKGDPVCHPEHYTAGKVEVIDILEQAVEDAPDPISGGLLWQTLKYLLRIWYKGNMLQDAKKARWYLNRLITHLERNYV